MANLSYGGAATSSYLDLARKGQIYMAQAIVTAPVISTTAAGTGGPLLWNGTGGVTAGVRNAAVDAVILGIGFGATVASTVATTFGVTGGAAASPCPPACRLLLTESSKCHFIVRVWPRRVAPRPPLPSTPLPGARRGGRPRPSAAAAPAVGTGGGGAVP